MISYYFTLSASQAKEAGFNSSGCVEIVCEDQSHTEKTYSGSRKLMFATYPNWTFQYKYLQEILPRDRTILKTLYL